MQSLEGQFTVENEMTTTVDRCDFCGNEVRASLQAHRRKCQRAKPHEREFWAKNGKWPAKRTSRTTYFAH